MESSGYGECSGADLPLRERGWGGGASQRGGQEASEAFYKPAPYP